MPVDLFTVGAGCLTWIPVAIMAVSLIQWMIAGDIDLPSGFLGLLVSVGLGTVAMRPPAPIHAPIALFVAVATVVVYPFLRGTMQMRELKNFEVDELERAYDLLGQQPMNPLPKFRVAKQLYVLGLHGHAIRIAEAVLPQLPKDLFTDEHRIWRQWQYTPQTPAMFAPISCSECGHRNDPGRTHCFQCGAPHLLNRFRGKILPKSQGRKILAAWIALVIMLVGLPFAGNLPIGGAVAVVIACLSGAALVLFLAFRPSNEGATA